MQARRRHGEPALRGQYHSSNYSEISTDFDFTSPSSAVDELMSYKDRTSEFLSTVKSLQSRSSNGAPSTGLRNRNAALRRSSEFTQIAKQIGRDIGRTFEKLEKLTQLAQSKSLFNDKPMEIQNLTFIIKEDLGSLNKKIAQLREVARSMRPHNNKSAVQDHSNSVVLGLQSKLASISNDFKSVLEVRTENLKRQKSRRDHFRTDQNSFTSHPQSAPPANNYHQASSDHLDQGAGSLLYRDEYQSRNRLHPSATGSGGRGGGGGQSSFLADAASGDVSINMDEVQDQGRGPAFQQQLQLIDQQDTYLQERADTMQSIESTIVELGGIFTQLAQMVHEQQEVITRIDSNVETTEMNVEAAHGELLKYFQSVTSNRWLMFKIFGVLILFFIIFVIFMT